VHIEDKQRILRQKKECGKGGRMKYKLNPKKRERIPSFHLSSSFPVFVYIATGSCACIVLYTVGDGGW